MQPFTVNDNLFRFFRSSLPDLFKIADWISSVWKHLNKIIESFHSAEQTIGKFSLIYEINFLLSIHSSINPLTNQWIVNSLNCKCYMHLHLQV